MEHSETQAAFKKAQEDIKVEKEIESQLSSLWFRNVTSAGAFICTIILLAVISSKNSSLERINDVALSYWQEQRAVGGILIEGVALEALDAEYTLRKGMGICNIALPSDVDCAKSEQHCEKAENYLALINDILPLSYKGSILKALGHPNVTLRGETIGSRDCRVSPVAIRNVLNKVGDILIENLRAEFEDQRLYTLGKDIDLSFLLLKNQIDFVVKGQEQLGKFLCSSKKSLSVVSGGNAYSNFLPGTKNCAKWDKDFSLGDKEGVRQWVPFEKRKVLEALKVEYESYVQFVEGIVLKTVRRNIELGHRLDTIIFWTILGVLVAMLFQTHSIFTPLMKKLNFTVGNLIGVLNENRTLHHRASLKNEYFASVVHELRTPSACTAGIARLLLDSKLDTSQQQDVRAIISTQEHLIGLVNDILHVSKIESSKLKFDLCSISPRRVCESVVYALSGKASEKNIPLFLEFDNNIPNFIVGDEMRIKQVLINFVTNALKFTDFGRVTIKACLVSGSSRSAVIEFSVIDTGIGIADDAQKTLFGSFQQADPSIEKKFQGTGLGLFISKKLIELMKGSVSLQSTVGEGTSVRFKIKFIVPKRGRKKTLVKGGKRSVYICEPVESDLLYSSSLFESWGFNVTSTNSYYDMMDDISILHDKGMPPIFIVLGLLNNDIDDAVTAMQTLVKRNLFQKSHLILASNVGGNAKLNEALVELNLTRTNVLNKPYQSDVLYPVVKSHYKRAKLKKTSIGVSKSSVTATQSSSTLSAQNSFGSVGNSSMDEELEVRFLKVLLAEDNVLNQRIMTKMLEKINVKPVVASDGREALEHLKTSKFDVVFMDMVMPNMNGYECVKAFREWQKGVTMLAQIFYEPKIYALTANSELKETESEGCAFDGLLVKPVSEIKLKVLLQEVCMKERRYTRGSSIDSSCLESYTLERNSDLGHTKNWTQSEEVPIEEENEQDDSAGGESNSRTVDEGGSYMDDVEFFGSEDDSGSESSGTSTDADAGG
eukprot:Nk52_evm7s914 gene=Nk52_evmTU7s914